MIAIRLETTMALLSLFFNSALSKSKNKKGVLLIIRINKQPTLRKFASGML